MEYFVEGLSKPRPPQNELEEIMGRLRSGRALAKLSRR